MAKQENVRLVCDKTGLSCSWWAWYTGCLNPRKCKAPPISYKGGWCVYNDRVFCQEVLCSECSLFESAVGIVGAD